MSLWHDKSELEAALRQHQWSNNALSRTIGCSETVIRKWRKIHGITGPNGNSGRSNQGRRPKAEKAGTSIRGDEATIITDPRQPEDIGDLDGMLRRRGLNPDEWQVSHVGVNEWEAYAGRDDGGEPLVQLLRQLKCTLKKRIDVDWFFPAVEVEQRYVPANSSRIGAGDLIVFVGDQQADYHDEELHQAFLRWLDDVKPVRGVLLGDTLDLPTISRHPDRPHWNSTPQACINAGYRLLSDYRDASPATSWQKLRGNHDWRLESELLTRAERTFGITPADIPGETQIPGHSIRRYLHLDRLGIELVGREGDDWKLAELVVGPGLVARHSAPTREKWIRLGRDIIAGHTHRQSLTRVTSFDSEDRPVVRTIIEAGCMCRTDTIGYDEHSNWQGGFVTAAVLPDGTYSYDLATWRNGRIAWRGEQWGS